jgi:hypothetical protein
MGRGPCRFTEADVRRAIKAAKREGLERVVFLPDGTIRFSITQAEKPVPVAMEFITQQYVDENRLPTDRTPRIYFVRLGRDRATKIGFTTNLQSRLKTYRTGSSSVHLLIAFEGTRDIEKQIHQTLSDHKVERELFDGREVDQFISILKYGGLGAALKYYQKPTIEESAWRGRNSYLAEYRQQKATFDERCSAAVAQRRADKGF